MVMLKVTNSYVSVPSVVMPVGGGWAWPCCNTGGWPRGCGCDATLPGGRSGRCRPARSRRPRCVAPISWSGSWPRWRWARWREGGPR
jgi:hypothetical protein